MNFLPQVAPMSLIALATLAGCGGGDGEGSGGAAAAPTSSDVAVRFSDAPVDDANQVVVTVDTVTFQRENGEDIVVERFTSDELGIVDAETFTVDLLDLQGERNRLVLDSVVLPVGGYSDLRLDIVDEDVNFSYVEESSDSALKPIKVPSGELKLGAFDVSPISTQTFVIEFGLRQSMTYNPGPDRYILKPRGVRVVALEQATTIEGSVDLDALHRTEPCDAKDDPSVGNAAYLYAGHALEPAALADDFDAELAGLAADGRIAPLASASLGAEGAFVFSYLEPGDYTVAISCVADGDDPDAFDAIAVPAPATERVETSVAAEELARCTLGDGTPTCRIGDDVDSL